MQSSSSSSVPKEDDVSFLRRFLQQNGRDGGLSREASRERDALPDEISDEKPDEPAAARPSFAGLMPKAAPLNRPSIVGSKGSSPGLVRKESTVEKANTREAKSYRLTRFDPMNGGFNFGGGLLGSTPDRNRTPVDDPVVNKRVSEGDVRRNPNAYYITTKDVAVAGGGQKTPVKAAKKDDLTSYRGGDDKAGGKKEDDPVVVDVHGSPVRVKKSEEPCPVFHSPAGPAGGIGARWADNDYDLDDLLGVDEADAEVEKEVQTGGLKVTPDRKDEADCGSKLVSGEKKKAASSRTVENVVSMDKPRSSIALELPGLGYGHSAGHRSHPVKPVAPVNNKPVAPVNNKPGMIPRRVDGFQDVSARLPNRDSFLDGELVMPRDDDAHNVSMRKRGSEDRDAVGSDPSSPDGSMGRKRFRLDDGGTFLKSSPPRGKGQYEESTIVHGNGLTSGMQRKVVLGRVGPFTLRQPKSDVFASRPRFDARHDARHDHLQELDRNGGVLDESFESGGNTVLNTDNGNLRQEPVVERAASLRSTSENQVIAGKELSRPNSEENSEDGGATPRSNRSSLPILRVTKETSRGVSATDEAKKARQTLTQLQDRNGTKETSWRLDSKRNPRSSLTFQEKPVEEQRVEPLFSPDEVRSKEDDVVMSERVANSPKLDRVCVIDQSVDQMSYPNSSFDGQNSFGQNSSYVPGAHSPQPTQAGMKNRRQGPYDRPDCNMLSPYKETELPPGYGYHHPQKNNPSTRGFYDQGHSSMLRHGDQNTFHQQNMGQAALAVDYHMKTTGSQRTAFADLVLKRQTVGQFGLEGSENDSRGSRVLDDPNEVTFFNENQFDQHDRKQDRETGQNDSKKNDEEKKKKRQEAKKRELEKIKDDMKSVEENIFKGENEIGSICDPAVIKSFTDRITQLMKDRKWNLLPKAVIAHLIMETAMQEVEQEVGDKLHQLDGSFRERVCGGNVMAFLQGCFKEVKKKMACKVILKEIPGVETNNGLTTGEIDAENRLKQHLHALKSKERERLLEIQACESAVSEVDRELETWTVEVYKIEKELKCQEKTAAEVIERLAKEKKQREERKRLEMEKERKELGDLTFQVLALEQFVEYAFRKQAEQMAELDRREDWLKERSRVGFSAGIFGGSGNNMFGNFSGGNLDDLDLNLTSGCRLD